MTRDIDGLVRMAGRCEIVDAKARICEGGMIDALEVLVARTAIDSMQRIDGALGLLDTKARVRDGRVVETLDALLGSSSGDAVVRLDAAALQLIDVKAHVLGGFA